MSAEWKAEIRFLSSTEKDNTSSIPRIKMQFLIFYSKEKIDSANGLGFTYLYLCRKSAHWHSSIFKIGTVGKPAIREEMEYMQNVKSSGCSSGNKTRTDCYSSKKRFQTPRCNANPWKSRKRFCWARLHARVLYYTIILGRGESINKPCGRKVSERLKILVNILC